MKSLTLALLLAFSSLAIADGCTTQTIFIDGRVIVCTTCCYAGQCSHYCN